MSTEGDGLDNGRQIRGGIADDCLLRCEDSDIERASQKLLILIVTAAIEMIEDAIMFSALTTFLNFW